MEKAYRGGLKAVAMQLKARGVYSSVVHTGGGIWGIQFPLADGRHIVASDDDGEWMADVMGPGGEFIASHDRLPNLSPAEWLLTLAGIG